MTKLRRAWNRASILHKVLAGNAVVILVGAIGGTYLTQHLLTVSWHWLALFFAAIGITLSLVINCDPAQRIAPDGRAAAHG